MRLFTPKPGTKTAVHTLKTPLHDIAAFTAIVQSLVLNNPLGCTSYYSVKKHHPPVQIVREMYTAKLVYTDKKGKRVGIGIDRYDSVDGYETGIAAAISNMANIASHRGNVKREKDGDLFSVLLKCHDENGERYFLSLARDRVTLSSYDADEILQKVRAWTGSVPELA